MTSRRASTAPGRITHSDGPLEPDDVAVQASQALPPVELGPIIKSKIQPPALRESTLTRQRLLDRLTEATSHRLTLLIAEAGYGKTTLLADFARATDARVMWYRLDASDADVITWSNYLIAAVREIHPGFGEATLRLMSEVAAGAGPTSAFVSSVIGELGAIEPASTLLVLDDFQAVDQSDEAIDFVRRLAKDAPPWLRLVLSSRRRPPLEVARLAAAGELYEVSTEHLRFSLEETHDLFAKSYESPLDDDVLAELDARKKGWAASLQLFHGSIRGRPPEAVKAFVSALSGASSPIYDFLAEEVLSSLPAQLERFLVRASLLQRISE